METHGQVGNFLDNLVFSIKIQLSTSKKEQSIALVADYSGTREKPDKKCQHMWTQR